MMENDTNDNQECEPVLNALSEQLKTRVEGNQCAVKDISSYPDDHSKTSSLCINAAIINKVRINAKIKCRSCLDHQKLSFSKLYFFVSFTKRTHFFSRFLAFIQTFHLFSGVKRLEIPNCFKYELLLFVFHTHDVELLICEYLRFNYNVHQITVESIVITSFTQVMRNVQILIHQLYVNVSLH